MGTDAEGMLTLKPGDREVMRRVLDRELNITRAALRSELRKAKPVERGLKEDFDRVFSLWLRVECATAPKDGFRVQKKGPPKGPLR